MAVEQLSQVNTDFLEQVNAAGQRYAARTAQREEHMEALAQHGILYADTRDRVSSRLNRLGVDWAMATAIERTPASATIGTSLDLDPELVSTDLLALERFMGRNDLVDIGYLEAGYLASRSVGRVTVRTPRSSHHGTGFLVSPSLLMTNNHVLKSPEEADAGVIEFNFQSGVDGQPLMPVVFRLEPRRFFVTHRALDFTLVAVAEASRDGRPLAAFGTLPLREAQGKATIGELVNIIQHPNGEPKQLALRENQIVDVLDDFLQYKADTAFGSSGAPVLNDQWEVVALHHAGAPRRDRDGNILAVDGSLWRPDMGEHRIDWKANEGIRVSRIIGTLQQFPLSGGAAALRAELLAAGTPPHPVEASPRSPQVTPGRTDDAEPHGLTADWTAGRPTMTGGGARWTVPLHLTVSLDVDAPRPQTESPQPAPAPPPSVRPITPSIDGQSPAERDLAAALLNLASSRERPYYDEAADLAAREAYYAGIRTDSPEGLRLALTQRLESTHDRRPAYKPMRLLYPWVDLHPDEKLHGIYSDQGFTPQELIEADAAVEAARFGRWQEFMLHESAPGPEAIEAELDLLEASLPFNCEHVVPQSWFAKKEPMRGDLHHLFACESTCNSFRGNIPYFDFPDFDEVVRHACGRREPMKFEPSAGKGPVARATLYFLLRYPGVIGDEARELQQERLGLLLRWHKDHPAGTYELHRNAAIAEMQGNRNPLIDHPEWAERIDFAGAWR
ncbi:endonuclease [Streptomyces sp. RerS4]|uniref:endonuclease n=1 Tax=Streptomyces sp. RerS4 TaxID=2942449 RepID=UPI00201BB534|nr:endonuclease [Streptomyces sp. RerS4]UQX05251.1 endonuclease [Streptomyces sp. RerS4]